MQQPNRIAVFLPNWVGDVVMATPALRAINERWPRAETLYLGRPIALQTLVGTPWASRLIADRSREGWRGFFETASTLRQRRIDLGVLMPNSFRSAALFRMGGCRRVVGYDRDGRGVLLTDRLSPQRLGGGGYRPSPMLDYYNDLAVAAGTDPPSHRMELPLTAEHEQQAEEILFGAGWDRSRPTVILNPGASFGPSKMWGPRRYGHLADELVQRRGAQIVINNAPSEKAIALEVEDAMHHRPLLSFARRDNSLPLLRSLVARCDLMVTNDTGARHFAAAFGKDLVTLFGSTDPRWTHLYYPREREVRVALPCSPCQRKLCHQPAGPLYHKCMADVTVESVLAPCLELLDSNVAVET